MDTASNNLRFHPYLAENREWWIYLYLLRHISNILIYKQISLAIHNFLSSKQKIDFHSFSVKEIILEEEQTILS